ncbi:MAG: AAA family ATPase [Capsulimonas sp.]|uniref:chloramphenicol phosphotransferase CPT family protein n=1 Tax=Capsulimonas sp. TaxID=2494211 RepID=UPI003265DFAE
MNPETIIILNGASSSGKTSLCKELQRALLDPYIHLEEDRFVYGTYHGRYLQPGIVEQTFTKTMLGYYRSIAAFASAGHNVLADTGFYSRDLLSVCVQELAPLRVWLVGVHCSLSELERREAERKDREPGQAREQHSTIHTDALYDIEVDTSAFSLSECALQIKARIESDADPAAMRSLKTKMTSSLTEQQRRF